MKLTYINQATLLDPLAAGGLVTKPDSPITEGDNNKPLEAPAGDKPVFDFEDIITTTKHTDFKLKPEDKPLNLNKETEAEPAVEETEEPLEDKDGVKLEEAHKKTEPPPVEDKTPEALPEPPAKPAALPSTRNYDGFDPEEVKILKNMKNEHFAIMSKRLQEYKTLGKSLEAVKAEKAELQKTLESRGVPPNWYDHPEAYTLTPEFQQIQTQFDMLTGEKSHYEQQLMNIMAGKPFHTIVSYINGQPQYSQPIEPNDAYTVKIQSILAGAAAKEAELRGRAMSLQNTFKSTYTSSAQAVRQGLEQRIQALLPELRPKEEDSKLFVELILPTFKGHPMTETAATLFGLVIRQAAVLKEWKEKLDNKARIANDVKEAGSNTRNLPKSGASAPPANGGKFKLRNGKEIDAVLDINSIVPNGM